jgi:hypothetical protein
MQDIWVPPREFQRIDDVPAPGGSSYTLFFPLEIKNKDYVVRGLDIIAMGIQRTVKSMHGKHGRNNTFRRIEGGLPGQPYDFNNTFDLHYLTKHIMDNARIYAEGIYELLLHVASHKIFPL